MIPSACVNYRRMFFDGSGRLDLTVFNAHLVECDICYNAFTTAMRLVNEIRGRSQ